MKKNIKIFCSWDLHFDLFNDIEVELYVDTIPSTPIPEGVKRFVFLLEPPEILDLSSHALIGMNNNYFDYLFTHNQKLLDTIPNSHLFEFGTSWIKNYEDKEKEFNVSTLVGGRLMAPGHFLRQKIWFKEKMIKNIPTEFFISGNYAGTIENYNKNKVLGPNKEDLFNNSQFHICIENVKRQNWFTEKLMDCFMTKTIPIYYGCPNIGDYFNLEGMYIVDNANEIIDTCNSITENTYKEKEKFVLENYENAKNFLDIGERLKIKITEILNK